MVFPYIRKAQLSKYCFLILALFIFDQLAKYFARMYLQNDYIVIIPEFIALTYIENKGISFGFLSNIPDIIRNPFLIITSLLVIIVIFFYTITRWNSLQSYEKIGFSLIQGGAIGNLFDRIVYQSVTDFVHFQFFGYSLFINNLADDFISIGFTFLLISMFLARRLSS